MNEDKDSAVDSHHVATENRADTVSFWTLLVGLFLSPIFFIPSSIVPLQSAKAYLFFFVVIVAATAWIVVRLKDGKLTLPRSWLYAFFLAIPAWFLISALFSPNRSLSLVGGGYEVGTFAFIAAMFLLCYLVSILFRNTRQSAYAYLAFFISFVLVVLFQFVRLFNPGIVSFGVFTTTAASIVGSWSDLGIYFGGVALFAFITLELLTLETKYKYWFTAIMAVALFMLSIVDFSTVWYVLAASAVIFFVYNFSFKKSTYIDDKITNGDSISPARGRRLPWASLVIFIISIIFILLKSNVYTTLANPPFNASFLGHFSVPSTEVWPSLQSTISIASATLHSRPLVGTGPNRFASEWSLARPVSVNTTPFWNTTFDYGVGLIPTFLVTVGPIGFLLWLGFFALFLWLGFRSLFARKENMFAEYVTVSSFIIALYFWIFSVIYVPSAALLVLTFFFTGIFLGSLTETNLLRFREFDFTTNPKTSFISVLVFVVLLLVGLMSIYGVTRRFVSVIYFNAAIADANNAPDGVIGPAHNDLVQAIQFNPDPLYYRSLAQLDLGKIQQLLATSSSAQSLVTSQFKSLLGEAQAAATAARDTDKTDYQNWLVLGQIAESVVPLNVSGAYAAARSNYEQAETLNPVDPSIPLMLAHLDFINGTYATATAEISQALTLKNDYTDAIFLEAQIQIVQGDTVNAIKSLQAATLITPNNSGLYFDLGLLYYNEKDWTSAANAFQQAINLVPQYANAQYFLGLAYAKLGNTSAALAEFQNLAVSNPNNSIIATIISNLKAGHDPLAGLTPPASTPQNSSKPLVKDTTTGGTVISPTKIK